MSNTLSQRTSTPPAGSLAYALATREDQLMGDSPMPAPEVFVGVDVAKGRHYACAVSARGEALFSRAVPNDEAAVATLCLIRSADAPPLR